MRFKSFHQKSPDSAVFLLVKFEPRPERHQAPAPCPNAILLRRTATVISVHQCKEWLRLNCDHLQEAFRIVAKESQSLGRSHTHYEISMVPSS